MMETHYTKKDLPTGYKISNVYSWDKDADYYWLHTPYIDPRYQSIFNMGVHTNESDGIHACVKEALKMEAKKNNVNEEAVQQVANLINQI